MSTQQRNKKLFDSITKDSKPLPTGETFQFIRTGASTNGTYLCAKAVIPPNVGPLPHVHHNAEEWFYTPVAGITMFVGSKQFQDTELILGFSGKDHLNIFTMGDHDLAYSPSRVIHSFINDTNQDLLLYFVWSPDSNEHSALNYFRETGVVTNGIADIHIPATSYIKAVSEAPKFGINQSHSFWQYVESVAYIRPDFDDQFSRLENMILASEAKT